MRRILVVDDEPAIRTLLSSYLVHDGYAVDEAGDGEAALAALRAHPFDLVLLDIMLPGMDGLEVLRQLRTFSDVYVILVTARTEEVDKLVGLRVGADDYITKPFSPREVLARVQAVLRRERDRAGGENDRRLRFERVAIDLLLEDGKVVSDAQPVQEALGNQRLAMFSTAMRRGRGDRPS